MLQEPVFWIAISCSALGAALLTWLIQSKRGAVQITRLQAELEASRDKLETVRNDRAHFEGVVAQVSNEVLGNTARQLAEQADRKMADQAHLGAQDFQQRQKAIEDMVTPLQKGLEEMKREVLEARERRAEGEGKLKGSIDTLSRNSDLLVRALRQPKVRGQWGELQLKQTLEMAGLSRHASFTEQMLLRGEEGRLFPDVVLHLPNGRLLVIDAKAPVEAYLRISESESPADEDAARSEYAKHIRTHVNHLGKKDYGKNLESSPEFVVLFLPGEVFFSAAMQEDPDLLKYATDRQVILASPTTLIALLFSVAQGWKEAELAENARKIGELGTQMIDRISRFSEAFGGLQKGLDSAVKAYNQAVGSMESRVLPAARRMAELSGHEEGRLQSPPVVEENIRPITAPELSGDGASAVHEDLFGA